MLSKSVLRKTLRLQRRQLSLQEQKSAARQLSKQLFTLPQLKKAKHIAIYWPNDGEISPYHYLQQCKHAGKIFYLPSLLNNGQLTFKPFFHQKKMKSNIFGIAEPLCKKSFSARSMDVVLMPLVAFDKHGNRLGMGGGFYDKTFAFKKKQLWRKKPLLIGLAHDFQEVASLHNDSWDIPLSAIVTNKRKL